MSYRQKKLRRERPRARTAMVKARKTPVTFPGCKVEDHGTYLVAKGLLNKRQLKQADRYFYSPAVQKEVEDSLMAGEAKPQYRQRKSRDCVLYPREEPMLFRRLSGITKAADKKFKTLQYRSDGVVQPRYDPLQYTEYHGDQGHHFSEWHTDAMEGDDDEEDTREITAVLMLSPSTGYAGGKFQVKRGGRSGRRGGSEIPPPKSMIEDVKLEAGDAVVFPAKKLWHRVTKTSAGLRRTVVFWTG